MIHLLTSEHSPLVVREVVTGAVLAIYNRNMAR